MQYYIVTVVTWPGPICFSKLHKYCNYQSENGEGEIVFPWRVAFLTGRCGFPNPSLTDMSNTGWSPSQWRISFPPLPCTANRHGLTHHDSEAHAQAHLFFYVVVFRPQPRDIRNSITHISLRRVSNPPEKYNFNEKSSAFKRRTMNICRGGCNIFQSESRY